MLTRCKNYSKQLYNTSTLNIIQYAPGARLTPSQSYGTSLVIWDHTVLPVTQHK